MDGSFVVGTDGRRVDDIDGSLVDGREGRRVLDIDIVVGMEVRWELGMDVRWELGMDVRWEVGMEGRWEVGRWEEGIEGKRFDICWCKDGSREDCKTGSLVTELV
jgi:hypothetical protein